MQTKIYFLCVTIMCSKNCFVDIFYDQVIVTKNTGACQILLEMTIDVEYCFHSSLVKLKFILPLVAF